MFQAQESVLWFIIRPLFLSSPIVLSFSLCVCSGWQNHMEQKLTIIITVWHCTQGILPERMGGGIQTTSTNSYPIYDQSLQFLPPYFLPGQKFDNLFMTFAAGTVALNIIMLGFWWRSSWYKWKVASSKKHTKYFQTSPYFMTNVA